MQFSVPALTNSSAEAQAANNYPDIRLFTVGQGTNTLVRDNLVTIEQTWGVASNVTVSGNGGFGYMSAVCWLFGKAIYDNSPSHFPIGLISNNWVRYLALALMPLELAESLSCLSAQSSLFSPLLSPLVCVGRNPCRGSLRHRALR